MPCKPQLLNVLSIGQPTVSLPLLIQQKGVGYHYLMLPIKDVGKYSFCAFLARKTKPRLKWGDYALIGMATRKDVVDMRDHGFEKPLGMSLLLEDIAGEERFVLSKNPLINRCTVARYVAGGLLDNPEPDVYALSPLGQKVVKGNVFAMPYEFGQYVEFDPND